MREYRFDVVRVVCMTYIIAYFHLYGYVYPQGQTPVSVAMAHACLGLFTFVSGYLLGKKYSFGKHGNCDVGSFFTKRILRVVPLFVISSIALYIINFNSAGATWNGLLCISPFVDPKPLTLYYIPIILWCYLITPLISRHGVSWRLISCLTLFVFLLVACFLFPSIDNRFVFDVFFYFVGIISASCFDWKINTSYGKTIKTIILLLFLVLIVVSSHFSLLNGTIGQMAVGAVGVFVILFICNDASLFLFERHSIQGNKAKVYVCKIINVVSYASMACYLFHRLFYWLVEILWNPSDVFAKWLYMAVMVYPVIVALSYVIQSSYDKVVKTRGKMWLSFAVILLFCYLCYQFSRFVDKEFAVAKELPFYDVRPSYNDDTLRVAIIGDSWAEYHATFNCDSLFQQYARKLTDRPVICQSRGKGGALSKEIFYLMFSDSYFQDQNPHDVSTKPLLEAHPDYCVVMAGINDTWKKRPISYYTGNYRLIIKFLLANNIRPVVMEIPDFEMGDWLNANRKRQRFLYRIYSYFTGVVEDDINPFRDGLKNMLRNTGLVDSVLYIPACNWLPQDHNYSSNIYQTDHVHLNYQGYHLLDSCIASEIVRDNSNYTDN